MKRMLRPLTVVALLLAMTTGTRAQAPSRPGLVPLKVTVVLSRLQGEKKISSLPYTLFVTANEPEVTRLRMGTQVPVPTTVFQPQGAGPAAIQSYNYKDVGTNIDCRATSESDGTFKLMLTVTDSAVYFPDKTEAMVASASTGAPAFRNFNSTVNVLLRDGQTVQYTSVADPVSGQTIRLEATVNVVK